MNRQRSEAGTALVEFVWLAIVLLMPFLYLLIAVFDVQRASFGVSAASQSAAQSFIGAPDVQTAYARAQKTAELALADHELTEAQVAVRCLPAPEACLQPHSSVRVTITVRQSLPLTPTVLGDQLAPVTVDSSHTEPYGRYREDKP